MEKHTRFLILIFYLGAAIWCVGQLVFGEIAGISLIMNVVIALAPTMWLIRDVNFVDGFCRMLFSRLFSGFGYHWFRSMSFGLENGGA